jgi:hypothetical protein
VTRLTGLFPKIKAHFILPVPSLCQFGSMEGSAYSFLASNCHRKAFGLKLWQKAPEWHIL